MQEKEAINLGGQAVIEGVMMRSPHTVATAVRNPAGQILINAFQFKSLTRRSKFWGLYVIRGAVILFEALYIGIKTLNWSAEVQNEKQKTSSRFRDQIVSFLTIVISLILGFGLFMLLPYWISGLVREAGGSQFAFHLVAGLVRIMIFLLYLYIISLWKDVRRIFQYHGAEHKTIFSYEKAGEANLNQAQQESRFHPRCGTSFILITALVIILLFAILDSILVPVIGVYRTPLHRFLVHLPFIPLVAGLSYEILKLSGKKSERKVWGWLIKPGLWLQHITTREPDKTQMEVAIAAINASLQNEKQGSN